MNAACVAGDEVGCACVQHGRLHAWRSDDYKGNDGYRDHEGDRQIWRVRRVLRRSANADELKLFGWCSRSPRNVKGASRTGEIVAGVGGRPASPTLV